MDKLVERENATRSPLVAAPALAVQFFLIPLAVVGIRCCVYIGFRSLLTDERTPQEYLAEIKSGGMARQWPAAFELSQQMDDPKVRGDKQLAVALVEAFDRRKTTTRVFASISLWPSAGSNRRCRARRRHPPQIAR